MNINSIMKDKKCCGCTACYNICNIKAIKMIPNSEGFLYPYVDNAKCVKCTKCINICPVLNDDLNRNTVDNRAYAVKNKNQEIRSKSSSGGAFYALASNVINSGGVIYGAIFDDEFNVVHKRAIDLVEMKKMLGSKYVQSDLSNIFQDVKKDLKLGYEVLFSGTPCQINGLKKFLCVNYDNLITVEIICHGVPSPKVWKLYVKYFEKKNGKIKSIFFRDESNSWEKYSLRIEFFNRKKYIKSTDNDLYMRGFLSNLYLRPSCSVCHFKDKYRAADFTIADFWGIKYVLPKIYDGNGISLVLTHSKKAYELLNKLNYVEKIEVDYDEAIIRNLSLMNPSIANDKRGKFFNEIRKNNDIIKILYHYTKDNYIQKMKNFLLWIYSIMSYIRKV